MSNAGIGDFGVEKGSRRGTMARKEAAKAWRSWRGVLGLLILSAVPVIAGWVRLHHLANGSARTLEPERFVAAPTPVVLHIIGATLFCLLGAFQFAPSLRRHGSHWHRIAGRIALPAGLVAAVSGLWMALTFRLPVSDTALLMVFRLFAGTGMFFSLMLSLASVYRRDFRAHRAWSLRGYALGMGAGTQVVTHLPWLLIGRDPLPDTRALLLGAAWAINLLVAEWFIRRDAHATRRATA